MDLDALASQLFNRRRAETQEVLSDATTRTYIGTATADSHDGMVTVTLNGYETPAEDVGETQGYGTIEFPCGPNVKEGDSVVVSAVGGNALKTPMVVSSSGSGDRQQVEIEAAATTATKYITDITDDGIWVTPEGAGPVNGEAAATTSGWHISDALELFRKGVSMFKAYVENSVVKVRIGPWDSGHILIDSTGIDFRYAIHSIAKIVRETAGVTLSLGGLLSGAGHNAALKAYTDSDGWSNCEVSAWHNQSGYASTGADIAARAMTGNSQVYMHAKELTVSDTYSSLSGIYNVPMGNFGRLARCRIDIAFGTLTVPANSRADITLDWQSGGFDNGNYIASAMPMTWVNGFNNVAYCVSNRAADKVTVSAWNSNSYDVTQLIGCIGVDSRYGTVV